MTVRNLVVGLFVSLLRAGLDAAVHMFACGLVLFAGRAAADDLWLGNTNVIWSTGANWSSAPVNGDNLVFGAAGTSGTSLTNDIPALTVNNIAFNNSASAFTVGGSNTLTLNGNVTLGSGITSETLNMPLNVNNTSVFTANSGVLNLGNSIGGAGGVTVAGAGTVVMQAANSYSGITTIGQNTTLKMGAGIPQAAEYSANFAAYGTTVNGFQDYFPGDSGVISSNNWTTDNAAMFQAVPGQPLTVTGAGNIVGSGSQWTLENHLYFAGSNSLTSPGNMTELALVSLTGSGIGGREGIFVGSTSMAGYGMQGSVCNNAVFSAAGDNGANAAGLNGLQDYTTWGSGNAQIPPSNTTTPANNTLYWIEATLSGGTLMTYKMWPADGSTPESSAGTQSLSNGGQMMNVGTAGITGPLSYQTGNMDVYYTLIEAQACLRSQLAMFRGSAPTGLLPKTTTVKIVAGGTWDLNGYAQSVTALSDVTPGGGGSVINSAATVTSLA